MGRDRGRAAAIAGLACLAALVVTAAAVIRVDDSERMVAGMLLVHGRHDGDEGYRAPGTPIAAGLSVPEGARQAGPLFVRPVPTYPSEVSTGSAAVLDLTGNPLEVWDALVGQAAAVGVALSASGGACEWQVETTTSVAEAETQIVSSVLLDGAPPPEGTIGLLCLSRGVARSSSGPSLVIEIELSSSVDGSTALVRLMEATNSEVGPWPETVDGERSSAVERDGAPQPDGTGAVVGSREPFGSEVNCLERGYDRLVVPPGARVLALGPRLGSDYTAVIAVDDAEAALTHLADQMLAEAGDMLDDTATPRRVAAEDGSELWTLEHSVAAGGGYCSVTASPDGYALLVEPHSD